MTALAWLAAFVTRRGEGTRFGMHALEWPVSHAAPHIHPPLQIRKFGGGGRIGKLAMPGGSAVEGYLIPRSGERAGADTHAGAVKSAFTISCCTKWRTTFLSL